MNLRRSLLAFLMLLLPFPVLAEEKANDDPLPETVSYFKDVRPIVQAHCQGCHQPAKPLGELVLVDYEGLFKAGESGDPAIVVGKPDESYLIELIVPTDGEAEMPKNRDPLSARQIALIKRWVEQGAKNDTPESAAPKIDMEHPPVYKLPPIITSLDYSPDGKILAVSGYHEVLLHDATNPDGNKPLARLVGLSERIESVRFSPDGKQLAVIGGSPARFGEIQIWDVAKRELVQSVMTTYDTIYGGSWSTDGTRLAYGCSDNSLRAIDVKTGKQVLYQGAHSDWVLSTVWSKDDSHLVSVSRDMSMKLTEVKTQRFVDNITSITPGALKGGLHAVDRHPKEDQLLVAGSDGVPKLYQMYRTKARKIGDDFNRIRAYAEMPGRLFAARFSSDGNLICAGSSFQTKGEARVFQTADAKQLSVLEGQKGGVFAVGFAPDSKQVATGGFDGSIRINDPSSGKLLKEFVPVPLTDAAVAAK